MEEAPHAREPTEATLTGEKEDTIVLSNRRRQLCSLLTFDHYRQTEGWISELSDHMRDAVKASVLSTSMESMINWSSNLSSINEKEEAPHAREPAEATLTGQEEDTSVLSRRWRHLCSSLRRLTFDHSNIFGTNRSELRIWRNACIHYKDVEGYPDFQEPRLEFFKRVDQFFLNFKGTKIDSLSVRFFIDEEMASRANQWISSAIALGVEELELDFTNWKRPDSRGSVHRCSIREEDFYTFPHWLFTQSTGSSLKHLSLQSCILRPQAEVGEGFSKLKTLRLEDVYLDQVSMEAILSKCLLLEELNLITCKELSFLKVGVSSNITLLDAPRLSNLFLSLVPSEDVSHALSLCSGKPLLIDPILKMPLKADSEERNMAFDQVDDAVARQRQRIGTFDSIKLLKLFVSKHIVDVDLSLILRIINACPNLEKLELTHLHYAFQR
ncbi:hypothetical protein Tsubulata_050127 [Turnera subulata]|uniref:At1g61320/AtMIF1 LRR domain-containing protein n=1 Tax=Turnera subulata TaxID=218843 RepID=A0A9Q0F476_9ROSI|nr:hypothetical protein Tsubulata_050127 [Turnera subulata]